MTDILAEGRALAENYNSEAGGGFVNEGRKNAYECDSCRAYIVTIDRHPGVTPFGVKCGHCGALEGRSKGYRVSQHLEPTHEWYRPETLVGIDLERHPEIASTPSIGLHLALEYWKVNGLNMLADSDNVLAITRLINGGTNGLEDRKRHLAKVKGWMA